MKLHVKELAILVAICFAKDLVRVVAETRVVTVVSMVLIIKS